MFDSQKIDSYFEGKRSLEPYPNKLPSKGVSWRRFFKLVLPCAAAMLAGVMVIMPNIKKSADLQDAATLPRKGEMEKLHIEQTVFSSTDSKNRVNKIVAESVDETKAGSKIMKIVNPKGQIPTDSGIADISSDEGFFNQNNNILTLQKNVKAVVNDDTIITSSEAVYDFKKEYGWGNRPINAFGSWGNMKAAAFIFDKNAEILTLVGNNVINGKNGSLSAKEKTIVYQKENKTVSTGGAAASQNNSNIFADKIVAYFSKRGKKEIVRAEAFGNVIIKTAKETAKGEKGVYNLQTGEVVLFGNGKNGLVSVERENNVLRAEKITAYLDKNSSGKIQKAVASGRVEVITPKGFAKGDRGIYNPNTDKVELFDNVRIEQNGNFIEGAYAQTDLATSVSKIMGSSATKGRIYGTFYKTRKTNNGNAAKK